MSKNKKDKKTEVIEAEVVSDRPISKSSKIDREDYIVINDEKGIDLESHDLVPFTGADVIIPEPRPGEDLFKSYLRQIARYPLLTHEQEQDLAMQLKETGDIEVAKKLVAHNLRLVVKIAMEYKSAWQNIMDLIQEGNIGLMKAVSKYDPDKGAKLSYYASWWIKSYILKFILDNFRLVKIGTTNEQKKLFFNLLKEKDRLIQMGVEPDAKLIADNLGVSEKAVLSMDKRLSPTTGGEVSLDTPLGTDSGSSTLGDIISDHDEHSIEDAIAQTQSLEILQENLKNFVDGLKPRDKEIFKKRLLSEVPPSLQSIADEHGVSRERIRQIEERLLKNLKVYMSQYLR